mmetsp:Transcript_4749/g.14489  ORF Transcript_4749/g.14489 Transcript_4749/m.14489 type:complete len:964 (-) Transcript_4749:107-2998(-)
MAHLIRTIFLPLLLLITVASLAHVAHAQVIYVSASSGDDANAGTEAAPLLTLSAALLAGTEIVLQPGVYSGAANRNLTLPRAVDELYLHASDGTTRGQVVIDLEQDGFLLDMAQSLRLERLVVRGSSTSAVRMLNAVLTIEDCAFVDCVNAGGTGGAVAASASQVLVERSRFEGCNADSGGSLHLELCSSRVLDSEFTGYSVPVGAAVLQTFGDLYARNVHLWQGEGGQFGAGFSMLSGVIEIEDCLFEDLRSLRNMGMHASSHKAATMRNCVFRRCCAAYHGMVALEVADSSVNLVEGVLLDEVNTWEHCSYLLDDRRGGNLMQLGGFNVTVRDVEVRNSGHAILDSADSWPCQFAVASVVNLHVENLRIINSQCENSLLFFGASKTTVFKDVTLSDNVVLSRANLQVALFRPDTNAEQGVLDMSSVVASNNLLRSSLPLQLIAPFVLTPSLGAEVRVSDLQCTGNRVQFTDPQIALANAGGCVLFSGANLDGDWLQVRDVRAQANTVEQEDGALFWISSSDWPVDFADVCENCVDEGGNSPPRLASSLPAMIVPVVESLNPAGQLTMELELRAVDWWNQLLDVSSEVTLATEDGALLSATGQSMENGVATMLLEIAGTPGQNMTLLFSVPGVSGELVLEIPQCAPFYYQRPVLAGSTSITCEPVEVEPHLARGLQIAWGVLAGLGCLLAVLLIVLLIVFRARPIIHYSSPLFCVITCFGCLIAYSTVFAIIASPSDAACPFIPILATLGFVVTFSPLLLKIYRVWRLFDNDRLLQVCITNLQLLIVCGGLLLVQLVILAFWMGFSLPGLGYAPGDPSAPAIHAVCSSDNPVAFVVTELVFAGVLVVCGVLFSFKSRNASFVFNESRGIAISVNLLCFVAVIVLVVSYLQDDQDITNSFLALAFIVAPTFLLLVVFVPKFFHLDKDMTATSVPKSSRFTQTRHTTRHQSTATPPQSTSVSST